MKRRKHRVVVEITLEEPTTEKQARYTVQRLLDGTRSDHLQFVTLYQTKEFNRVMRAYHGK